jgi:hypothetical protein
MSLRRSALLTAISAAISFAALPIETFGQLTDKTIPFQFLPRPSIIVQTGGFGGFHNEFHIRGTFDLHLMESVLAVFPPVHIATFENVDAWGVHPHQDWVLDVNAALNLEGLHGGESLLRRGLFRFRGKTEDGSTVQLNAKLSGSWLYLRGGTMAPPHSADYFEYHIKAIARTRPHADFNDDGVVDGADLTAWASDSERYGADFLSWQRQLGEATPTIESLDKDLDAALAAAAAESVAAVPEPAAWTTAAIAAAALFRRRRRAGLGADGA